MRMTRPAGMTGEPGTGSTGKVGQARSDIAGKLRDHSDEKQGSGGRS